MSHRSCITARALLLYRLKKRQGEGNPVLYKSSYLCAANSCDVKQLPDSDGQTVPGSDLILGATRLCPNQDY